MAQGATLSVRMSAAKASLALPLARSMLLVFSFKFVWKVAFAIPSGEGKSWNKPVEKGKS